MENLPGETSAIIKTPRRTTIRRNGDNDGGMLTQIIITGENSLIEPKREEFHYSSERECCTKTQTTNFLVSARTRKGSDDLL